jgi:hypothetical protein
MAVVKNQEKGKHLQADSRRVDYFRDQHGRVWWAQVDKRTGDPVESLNTYKWSAPQTPAYLNGMFTPPEQYRMIVRSPGSPAELHIDYDAWIADWNQHYTRWDQARVDITNKMTDGFDAIKQLETPSPTIRRIVGPGPYPPLEIIQQMAEGDEWALGKTEDIPAWFTQEIHDDLVTTARQTRLFSPKALRMLGKVQRGELARSRQVANPKVRRKKETLAAMSRDELVEIAEAYNVPTSGLAHPDIVDGILAAYSGKVPAGV